MIVVKIEMWPLGEEVRKRELGRMYLTNVRGNRQRADYRVAVCRKGVSDCPWLHGEDDDPKKIRPQPTRQSVVENYPREQYNVWRLILRGLRNCFPEER